VIRELFLEGIDVNLDPRAVSLLLLQDKLLYCN